MITLAIIIIAVLLELFLTRLSYRWDRELTEAVNREKSQKTPVWHPIAHAFVWWLVIPILYFSKDGYQGRNKQKQTFWTDERVRKVIGESKWHRQERLALEHKERAAQVGMPES